MTERDKDRKKRVVIALQMAGKPGQRKMSGILDYLAEKDLRWEIRFVRHREDFSPDFVRALAANPVDGILYSFDTVPTVEAELAKIDIPTVGLDVFDQEPPLPADNPLLQAPNTVLAPHIAYRTKESMALRAGIVFDNIYKYAAGTPQNVCAL